MSKREVNLGPPHVDPSLSTNPAAQRYAQQLHQRKYAVPVAGGPTPPIPRLDQPHQTGMTMADQAVAAAQPQPASSDSGFIQPTGAPMHRLGSPAGPALLPSDLLPEQATKDPEYQQGAGSRYAMNQPQLAMKYGVIRNGQYVSPQLLSSGRPGLQPKTIEGLQALQQLSKEAQRPVKPEGAQAQAEREAASGVAGAAARLAGTSEKESIQPMTEEDREKVKKSLEKMDEFDFNTFREMMIKDILNNDEQRQVVEARCLPMDVTDLIMKGRVTQVVPIIPGKFEPEFQSLSAEEDLALKRLIMLEGKSLNVSERYLLDKYSLMGVAAGLFAVNKKVLPSHLDKDGHFNDDLFLQKFNLVIKYPFHMLSSLGINFFWFDVRVRMLFKAEMVKNG